MRALVLAAVIVALGAPAYAQGDAPKPAAKAAHKTAKAPARKRRNDGTDDAPVLRCRDVRTHNFTKCGGPYAEPVPAS